ncbi:type II toxin-antitoxin system RelE/ParE family toxin [Candidatus Pacearchaeota archaeon]|nr:type II toxin-antitoxin system RelE/ParE family toxin [Candidatus Pacearchaeota archaeon]
MYNIEFSKKAIRFLDKSESQSRIQILNGLEKIRIRPEAFLIKLVGERGYKLRIGDFRLFIDLNKEKLMISVIKIGHIKDIYK